MHHNHDKFCQIVSFSIGKLLLRVKIALPVNFLSSILFCKYILAARLPIMGTRAGFLLITKY